MPGGGLEEMGMDFVNTYSQFPMCIYLINMAVLIVKSNDGMPSESLNSFTFCHSLPWSLCRGRLLRADILSRKGSGIKRMRNAMGRL